jgi:hypothetical protein
MKILDFSSSKNNIREKKKKSEGEKKTFHSIDVINIIPPLAYYLF